MAAMAHCDALLAQRRERRSQWAAVTGKEGPKVVGSAVDGAEKTNSPWRPTLFMVIQSKAMHFFPTLILIRDRISPD